MSYIHDIVTAARLTVSVAVSYVSDMGKDDKSVVFNMRVPPEMIRLLDDMRRKEEDIPTRSEMARRCIEIAAAARGSKTRRS